MFATLLRRAREPLSKVTGAGAGSTAPSSAGNPFKARKVWPPNLEELTPQQQLRFEKKYKRRVVLAQRAPGWQKGVKYAQFATLTGMTRIPLPLERRKRVVCWLVEGC